MEAHFINPVIASILNVLSTMAHLEPKPGLPQKKSRDTIVQGRNITGLMSMVGRKTSDSMVSKKAVVSIALTFFEAAMLHIAKKMLPGEINRIDGIVIDLAGELANMALGGAKSDLESKGYLFQLSLPTIIVGSDYLIAHITKSRIIMLPFSMPEVDFFVEASYDDM